MCHTDTVSTGLHITLNTGKGNNVGFIFLGSIIRTFGLKSRCKIANNDIAYCVFTQARVFFNYTNCKVFPYSLATFFAAVYLGIYCVKRLACVP